MDENSGIKEFRKRLGDAIALIDEAVPGNGRPADQEKLSGLLEHSGMLVRSITIHLNTTRLFQGGEDREMMAILTTAREIAMCASGALNHEQPEERDWCAKRLTEMKLTGPRTPDGPKDDRKIRQPKQPANEQPAKRRVRTG